MHCCSPLFAEQTVMRHMMDYCDGSKNHCDDTDTTT